MIKYSPDYYPAQFLFIVVPVYVLIWVFAVFLGGGYEKPYRVSNIIRGVFGGTIAIAAVYAFLPEEWRFSRAIILLGAFWTATEMLLTRTLYHLIKYQSLFFEKEEEKRILITGATNECTRAEKLLLATGVGHELIIVPNSGTELKKLSLLYSINELIFCAAGISYGEIIRQIQGCGNRMEYKILNEGGDTFMGSNSKNTSGEIYSDWHRYRLAQPAHQRKKRIFDLTICLIGIPLLPLALFIVKGPVGFVRNYLDVFCGKKTWVGYSAGIKISLPQIRSAVISVSESINNEKPDEAVLENMNRLYAKYYSASDDLQLLWKYFRELGRR
ncbi:MAG: hypothetical protein IPP77_15865 [Bacteroidetes bacterium]|nr:hypothetical protein [Bacteroidota bacterium]